MKDILGRIAESSPNESSEELVCRLRDCAHEIEALRAALACRPDAQSASEDGSPHPCPFCGSALLQKNDHGYYVHPAGECFLREFEFGNDAVSAWNRRSSGPDTQADERGAE